MEDNFERAMDHLDKAAQRQKRYYDARARDHSFKVGSTGAAIFTCPMSQTEFWLNGTIDGCEKCR